MKMIIIFMNLGGKIPCQKSKYQPCFDLLRDVQISNSMKLLQIHNGYHNVYLSRTIKVKLFTERR